MPCFNIHKCKTCDKNDFETNLKDLNDNWYHPGSCIAAQREKENEALNKPYRPVICGDN